MHATRIGWGRIKNGELLSACEKAGFDVLITCDKSIRYQQNFTDRKIALVALSSNHWPTMIRVAPRIATAVDFAQRGQVIRFDVFIGKVTAC